MARPKKEGMDYFPHDVDAVNDEKIEALRSVFGNDGYAFYFILLERIYRTENAELDVSKPIILASVISKIGVTKEKFHEMMDAALDLDLFNRERFDESKVITGKGIKKRFSDVNKLRERWRKNKENTKKEEVFHEENPEENTQENYEENEEVTGESKVKESKVKKREVKKREVKKHSLSELPFDEESQEFRAAKYLKEKILDNNPNAKIPNTPQEINKWAKDIDLMHRIDKRTFEDIKKVIDFAHSDDFWMCNILSPKSLRKNFDKLYLRTSKNESQSRKNWDDIDIKEWSDD